MVLKRFKKLFVALCAVLVIGIAFGLMTACGSSKSSSGSSAIGTYYRYDETTGELDKEDWIKLESGGKFTMPDMEEQKDMIQQLGGTVSCTYKASGGNITLTMKITAMGQTETKTVTGTVKSGVLTLTMAGSSETVVYCKEGKTPNSDTPIPGVPEKKDYYTVIYDVNGGEWNYGNDTWRTQIAANTVIDINDRNDYPYYNPSKEKCYFKGWATDKNGSVMWDFEKDTVTEDITLYAIYEAAEFTTDSYSYNDVYGLEITGLTSSGEETLAANGGNLTIPSTIGMYDVIRINEKAFYKNTSIISVTIESGVKYIGYNAFASCSGLYEVSIPETVTSIGEGAFANCTGLEKIVIPSSVETLGSNAFNGCSGLIEATVNGGKIGYAAFGNCTGLETVNVGAAVTGFSEDVFNNCSNIAKVNISDIAAWCKISFYEGASNPLSRGAQLCVDNAAVTKITVPGTVTGVSDFAFYGCNSLEAVIIPSSATSIGAYAFCNNLSLSDVEIGANVTSLGNSAFRGCTSLETIVIPSKVRTVGNYAFYGCSSLSDVTIGDNVTSLGSYAFENCTSLQNIIIPDKVANIGGYAFYGCSTLEWIVIGSRVTSIGSDAFHNCLQLNTVYLKGTKNISVGSNNYKYTNAEKYYYSATQPQDADKTYWHYALDGKTPMLWN